MTTAELNVIKQYCNEVTASGGIFKITWNGGGDSGFFEFYLDDKKLDLDSYLDDLFYSFLSENLEYYSFAGDYETNGEIVYDRMNQCFIGEDDYSETQVGGKDCKIEIKVPKNLWFDRLELNYYAENSVVEKVEAELIVSNGPTTKEHLAWNESQSRWLTNVFTKICKNIPDEFSLYHQMGIVIGDFEQNELYQTYHLTSIEYYYRDTTLKEIEISLNN